MIQDFKFKVYYMGNKVAIEDEVEEFKNKFKEKFDEFPEVELISISKNTESAESNNILVTPTILRISPEPKMKIVGDFPQKEETWNKIIKE